MKKPGLPEFNNPPVVETVLSLQFRPLKGFEIPHFGLYWANIKNEYPKYEIQPPLSHIIERFGREEIRPPGVEVNIAPAPEVRCWFLNQSENRLIQIQKDRFIYNWKKMSDNEEYPRYDNIKTSFIKEWNKFCNFLKRDNFDEPVVNQCEIIYVNHFEKGKGWKSYGELHKIFTYWSEVSSSGFLPEPEMVSFTVRYVMPERKGRLYMFVQPGIRRKDAKEVLQLQVIARGRPDSSRIDDILRWFDMGHEWIVQGFTDFTTEYMHQLWGREK